MRTKRYSETQIIRILGEVESGKPVIEVARQQGVSAATIHRWKSRYGGLGISDLRKLKALEEDNKRLRRIVAQQAIDIDLLKDINSKKW